MVCAKDCNCATRRDGKTFKTYLEDVTEIGFDG